METEVIINLFEMERCFGDKNNKTLTVCRGKNLNVDFVIRQVLQPKLKAKPS